MNRTHRNAPRAEMFLKPILTTVNRMIDNRQLSVFDLAELCDCTRPTIYSWLNGTRPPPIDAVLIMAELAGYRFSLSQVVTVQYPRAKAARTSRRNGKTTVTEIAATS